MDAAAGCLKLCLAIVEQLSVAKNNKKECRSLRAVILCMQAFLENLPSEGMSDGGIKTLERIRETLEGSKTFLSKVTAAGPLVSLLAARDVRLEVQRFSNDLRVHFEMLGIGEKLVKMSEQRMRALHAVQGELKSSKTLFTDKEMVAYRLRDTAATAEQQQMHPEKLHSLLLHELEQVEEVYNLNPEELLAELQALQMDALYGTEFGGVKKKLMGDQTEEFLVEQICAACAPKAALANKPLTSAAAPAPPEGYLCPISKQMMTNPVMLIETGQTYEASNIQRWLQLHNTCPTTGKQLASKQTVINYALKTIIQQWAFDHGVRLPNAMATCDKWLPGHDAAAAAAGTGSSRSATQQEVSSVTAQQPVTPAGARMLSLTTAELEAYTAHAGVPDSDSVQLSTAPAPVLAAAPIPAAVPARDPPGDVLVVEVHTGNVKEAVLPIAGGGKKQKYTLPPYLKYIIALLFSLGVLSAIILGVFYGNQRAP